MSWIDDLEALGEAATPGEWRYESDDDGGDPPGAAFAWRIKDVCNFAEEGGSFENAEFIEAAHNHWPKIIAALRAADGIVRVGLPKVVRDIDNNVRMVVGMEDWYPLQANLAALSDAVTGGKP